MSSFLIALFAIALSASADPDPPIIDGGNVTFNGDWTVDPGDHLFYLNQTIKVNGNVTISPGSSLDLVNCTLYLNSTPPTGFPRGGLRVGTLGTLNVTAGSTVRALFLDYFRVDQDAHLLIEDSLVGNIGEHVATVGQRGLYSEADDTVVRRSTIDGGAAGLILDGASGCVVEDVLFQGVQFFGLYLLNGSSGLKLTNLSFAGPLVAVNIEHCTDVDIRNITVTGPATALGLEGSSTSVYNAAVSNSSSVVRYWTWGTVQWTVDGVSSLVNSTLRLNGSLEVLDKGSFMMVNSKLQVDNPSAHGVNGVVVRAGGIMSVTGGSNVTHVDGAFRYAWLVEAGGHLAMDGALVEGAGWDADHPGLVLESSDDTINATTFLDCYCGITVGGKGVLVSTTAFDGCIMGARVTGEDTLLRNLTLTNVTGTGLLIEGASATRVEGMVMLGTGAVEALNATASQDLNLANMNITGNISYGLRMTYVTDVLVTTSEITATMRCVNIEVGPYARSSNVTIEKGTLFGPFPIEVRGLEGLVLNELTVQGGNGGLVHLERVSDLVISSCHMADGDNVTLHEVTNGTLSLCQIQSRLSLKDSVDVEVIDCLVQSTFVGIHAENVTGLSATRLSVLDVADGIVLTGCSDAYLIDSLLNNIQGAALRLNEMEGSLLVNVTIVSALEGINITGGSNCTLRDIRPFSVEKGILVRGPGTGHELEDSTISSLPEAVLVGKGSQLTITRCSFIDCAMAISGDPGAEVLYSTDAVSEFVNSTCRMRGWLMVEAMGELNLTAASIGFSGANASDSGIVALAGSTLRLTQGTLVHGWNGTFSILANGSLVVRASTILGGGDPSGPAALISSGSAAVMVNVTFRDCGLALELGGSDPTINGCTFTGNRQSVLLSSVERLRMTDCSFNLSNGSWDIRGIFEDSLHISECSFEGGGSAETSIWLTSPKDENSVLSLRNVTISNYTQWGIQDDHYGNLLASGCSLRSADARFGLESTDAVNLSDLEIDRCKLEVVRAGLTMSDCVFINASFRVHNNSGGSLVTGCQFLGKPVDGAASLEVDGCIRITLRDLDLADVGVGLRVMGGSDVTVSDLRLDGAAGTALEVNGSIVRMEACALEGLAGTGVRVWNVGSRVEFRNGTMDALAGRAGYDVDASAGGDAWILNTTFQRTSVLTTGDGRVEVLWHVTVEPLLPWGDVLWTFDYLAVRDETGAEVVNRSTAVGALRLHEFSEANGIRTSLTPHAFNVSDHVEGVRYSGSFVINASMHLVMDLVDVASPVARAGPDQVVDEDAKITLDATGSSDNDPTFAGTGSFRWSFDEYGSTVVLQGDSVSYVFSVPGKYWVNLTVWDLAGNAGTDSVIIQVRDRTPPIIRFSGNVTVDEDDWTIMDASATTDNDPTFDFTTGRFLWSIDLVTEFLERDTATFGHSFTEPGNYTGTLSVWDNAGNVAQTTFWVAVLDITPPSIIGISDAIVFEPTDGLLDASSCRDNVGISSIGWSVTFHNWSGGPDGHYLLEGPTPTYSFDRLGSYTITLTLEDAAGNTNSTDISVVYDDTPVISLPSWMVGMAGVRFQVPVLVSDVYFTDLRVTIAEGPEGPYVEGTPPTVSLIWTPGNDVAGEDVVITLQVHDGVVSTSATMTVHVNPERGAGNSIPVIRSTPPLAAKRDTPYIYPVDAVDPDGDVLGYSLEDGPEGMSISQGGTVSWDPPFEQGTELVEVHLRVTDGRDAVEQSWTIRWREPPNASPLITFQLEPVEVRVFEEFSVDLSVHLDEPEAFDVDADDQNYRLVWDVSIDNDLVALLSREGLIFRFQAATVRGTGTINFTATDPSGASDTTTMDLVVKGREPPVEEEGGEWLIWTALVILVAVGLAGGAVVSRRRRRTQVEGWEAPDEHELDLGPPPLEGADESVALEAALAGGPPEEVGSFVELEEKGPIPAPRVVAEPVSTAPAASRVVGGAVEAERRAFSLEGVAVLEANGKVLASTGIVDEVIGPYHESVEEVRRGLRGDGLAVMELEGRRVIVALRSGLGALCIIRGREDDTFRSNLRDHLGNLFKDRSTEGALGVLDDVLASAGPAGTAEVVHDAWTARLSTDLSYQGSVVLLDVKLVNETEHILNNVRLRLHRDRDALSLDSITPKMLTSHGKMSLGNVPPRKEHKVAFSFVPEVCMSSTLRVMMTYTDMEGRTVHVPSPTIPVEVECPYIEAGVDMDEERLLGLSEHGLGFTGRRVFDHGMDVDYRRLYSIAVKLVSEQGLMKVMDLVDDSLMRAEAWFLGIGKGGSHQVLVRVSSHGADHLLEVFVTSDVGSVATGLLTHLADGILDTAASEIPGKRVERVRDSATLEEISVWPSLLDYKVMGD